MQLGRFKQNALAQHALANTTELADAKSEDFGSVFYVGCHQPDPLRSRLAKRRFEMACEYRANRTKPAMQDGQGLRRIKRRTGVDDIGAFLCAQVEPT